jgi:hypothetical protein
VKITGFVIVMLIAAPVFGAQPLPDENQILKLEDDWVRALLTHDRDVLDRIVARLYLHRTRRNGQKSS